MPYLKETIVAIATAPGRASVGIIRVSGPNCSAIARDVLGAVPKARVATYCPFYDENRSTIDEGLAIYFSGPHSFTGEDVLELQGHGGQVVMQLLLERVIQTGLCRLAKPGEFSEQAFLNDKMDLTQAEAIADLINASSIQAARSAVRSLQGAFSEQVNHLLHQLIHLRMYVEAAIDFPEEEIDFLSDGKVQADLNNLRSELNTILNQAKQGTLLREGMHIVIVGKPNAGKSSLLNALSGRESAIVTDIAGTTRDVIKEQISIDGMPLHIIDTAGLRESTDKVEQIGIERAWQEIKKADRILFMVDATTEQESDPKVIWPDFYHQLDDSIPVTVIRNKCDLTQELPGINTVNPDCTVICISAKDGAGVDTLKQHLKDAVGYEQSGEDQIIARTRHITALLATQQHVETGTQQLQSNMAGEILAEELRIAQQYLNEITGEFTSDDLLGKIFSSFCIGK